MKGKVENTIPQRQYENIKTTYYFENEEERDVAIKSSIADCIKYRDVVSAELNKRQKPDLSTVEQKLGVTDVFTLAGIKYRKIKGKWQYHDKSKNEWTGGQDGN